MDALILKDVRCFTDPDPAPLRPLTLLIGENSTGKSTFLAALRLVSQLAARVDTPDFNEEPFAWGAFDQISNNRGGRVGRAREFTVGVDLKIRGELSQRIRNQLPTHLRISGTFGNSSSQPFLLKWSAIAGPYGLEYEWKNPGRLIAIRIFFPGGTTVISPKETAVFSPALLSDIVFVLHILPSDRYQGDGKVTVSGEVPSEVHRSVFAAIFHGANQSLPGEIQALAPIRTEPKRTYEPSKDTPRPTGSHVPMILAKRYRKDSWREMKESLERFGAASGLFHGLDVRRLGRQESSPFQILIKIAGPAFNLVDVGYGVSQALPIVVDLLQGRKGQMFLLQQPEVHLHPRAQAELGTLLGQVVKSDKKRVIVETHSDYLLDRVRMDVRDGKTLRPEEVSILYFERGQTGVAIHHLSIDESGNLEGAPQSYRRFFLDEEQKFLVPTA